jgi:hypothetical protein
VTFGRTGYSATSSGRSSPYYEVRPIEAGTSTGPLGDKNLVGTVTPILRDSIPVGNESASTASVALQGRVYLLRGVTGEEDPTWNMSCHRGPCTLDLADPDVTTCHGSSSNRVFPCKYIGHLRNQWATLGLLSEVGQSWQPYGTRSGLDLALGGFAMLERRSTIQLGVEAGWQRSVEASGALLRVFIDFGFTASPHPHVHTIAHMPCSDFAPERCPDS